MLAPRGRYARSARSGSANKDGTGCVTLPEPGIVPSPGEDRVSLPSTQWFYGPVAASHREINLDCRYYCYRPRPPTATVIYLDYAGKHAKVRRSALPLRAPHADLMADAELRAANSPNKLWSRPFGAPFKSPPKVVNVTPPSHTPSTGSCGPRLGPGAPARIFLRAFFDSGEGATDSGESTGWVSD